MRSLTIVFTLGLMAPLHALIISGPNGTASGNTTQGSLNGFTGGLGLPAFPYWGNQIQVSDSTGMYLGSNDNYGWVMTAAHVSPLGVGSGVIVVGGTPYVVRDAVTIGSADIRLYRIGGGLGDAALPVLPNILMATTSPSIGTGLLDFGRGRRIEGTANSATNSDAGQPPGVNGQFYEWGSAANVQWGTNSTTVLPSWLGPPFANANFIVGPYTTNLFFSLFDDVGSGNYLNATEATFSVFDSGGGAFRFNGVNWELSGLNLYEDHDPANVSNGEPGAAQGFGDANFYGNIAAYRNDILTAMVPEPSLGLLLCGCGFALVARRRR